MKHSYTTYFAEIYDEVMKNVPYKYWFRYLKDLLKYYKHQPESVLELASGTANMTLKLIELQSVNRITALDLSSAMISKAAEKLEYKIENYQEIKDSLAEEKRMTYQLQKKQKQITVNFMVQDMADYSIENKFDLIVSFFDSLNYLTDIDQLNNCFKNAASSLSKNGLFIFDMNSLGRIRTIEEKSFKSCLFWNLNSNFSAALESIADDKSSAVILFKDCSSINFNVILEVPEASSSTDSG